MKLVFSIFLFLIFNQSALSQSVEVVYNLKTKGVNVGSLVWQLNTTEDSYKTSILLESNKLISFLYKFNGEYVSEGRVENGSFYPISYIQNWQTKKKFRNVKLFFNNSKVSQLIIDPEEKEHSRINYKDIGGFKDPVASFLEILFNNQPSKTIDGRRVYLLFPKISENYTKIIIKDYINIWADHKRNDLEYLELYKDGGGIMPKKIIINFKGSLFLLTKI